MVVDHEHADHRAPACLAVRDGRPTVSPPPGVSSSASEPPSSAARSRIERRPTPAGASSSPQPWSTTSTTSASSAQAQREVDLVGMGVALRVEDRLSRDPVRRHLAAGDRRRTVSAADVHLDAQRPSCLDHGADEAELVQCRRPQVPAEVPGPVERARASASRRCSRVGRQVGVHGDELRQRPELHGHAGERSGRGRRAGPVAAGTAPAPCSPRACAGRREVCGQADDACGAGAVVGQVAQQLALVVAEGPARAQTDPQRPALRSPPSSASSTGDRSVGRPGLGRRAAAELRLDPARPDDVRTLLRQAVEHAWRGRRARPPSSRAGAAPAGVRPGRRTSRGAARVGASRGPGAAPRRPPRSAGRPARRVHRSLRTQPRGRGRRR